MKVAITGGTGFLGKYLVKELLKYDIEPLILTRNRKYKNTSNYVVTDYSLSNLKSALEGSDALVHLAAKRGSNNLISDFHDNEIQTQNIYEACDENNISNIVYASSISVYSGEHDLPWTESNLPKPQLMYGISKMSCEYIGNIYSRKKGLKVKNLRFAHIFGANERNNYMINLFFRQALRKETLILNTPSTARREFLYVKDAVKAIICALKQESIKGNYNIGSGEALTNYDVAKKINLAFNNEGNLLIKNPLEKEGICSSFMDSSKAINILGFKPSYKFEVALNEIYGCMRGIEHVPLYY